MSCTQYDLNVPQPFVYAGSANRPAARVRFTGCIGIDITNNLMETWNGSAWKVVQQPFSGPPVAYTPALYTNSTLALLGTGGSATGWWTRAGDMVKAFGAIIIGTGPTISAGSPLEVTLPVVSIAASPGTIKPGGTGFVQGGPMTLPELTAYIDNAQLSRARFIGPDGLVTSTSPKAIAAGDVIGWVVDYQVA